MKQQFWRKFQQKLFHYDSSFRPMTLQKTTIRLLGGHVVGWYFV